MRNGFIGCGLMCFACTSLALAQVPEPAAGPSTGIIKQEGTPVPLGDAQPIPFSPGVLDDQVHPVVPVKEYVDFPAGSGSVLNICCGGSKTAICLPS